MKHFWRHLNVLIMAASISDYAQGAEVMDGTSCSAMVEAMDGGPAQFDVDDILAISGVDDEPGLLGAARYGTLQTRILES